MSSLHVSGTQQVVSMTAKRILRNEANNSFICNTRAQFILEDSFWFCRLSARRHFGRDRLTTLLIKERHLPFAFVMFGP